MTDKMFLYRCSAICLCLLALSCCSVKEDRSGCPCLLRLDMSDAGAEAPVKVNVLASDGFACSGLYGSDGGQDVPEMLFRIPKGPAHVLAVAGDEGCFSDFSGLRIPLGKECPSVFMYTSAVDASGESCEDKVRLCKNYCRISVRMATGPESPYPFSARIIGNVSGYSFMAVPEYGEFSCAMSQDGEGLFHANVPRQTDSSLILRMTEDDEVLRDFAIGEYLEAGGYDWTAENLADVELYIDYAKADITFIVEDWELSFSFDVVI